MCTLVGTWQYGGTRVQYMYTEESLSGNPFLLSGIPRVNAFMVLSSDPDSSLIVSGTMRVHVRRYAGTSTCRILHGGQREGNTWPVAARSTRARTPGACMPHRHTATRGRSVAPAALAGRPPGPGGRAGLQPVDPSRAVPSVYGVGGLG
eukprot:COSAG02_NODE_6680_length_3423_cov_1.648917_1_plen_149_part_00